MTAEGNAVSELREAVAKALFLLGTPLEPIGAGRAYDITDAVLALPELAALRAKATGADRVRELTFASDDGSEYEHDHGILDGHPECPACWVEDIRAALDGEQP